jgi:hypothetical protein
VPEPRSEVAAGAITLADAGLALGELQVWFQDQIVRPHERSDGDGFVDVPAVDRVLRPSHSLEPVDRMAIYSRMYMARLVDCLTVDHPACKQLLGPESWFALARRYLVAYPSRSWTLNVLGHDFPRFVAEAPDVPQRDLIVDVARLEAAMVAAFDGMPVASCERGDLARIPQERWADARFRMAAPFSLHAFAHPANAIVTAVLRAQPLSDLEPRSTWVAVYRKSYQVWRMDLSRPMYVLLRSLVNGDPFGAAIVCARDAFEGSSEDLQRAIFGWLDEFVHEGFFHDVSV